MTALGQDRLATSGHSTPSNSRIDSLNRRRYTQYMLEGTLMNETRFHRPSGGSVWLGKDMARRKDWIYRLPPAALAEIDACVEMLRRNPKPLDDIGSEDFPFASIAEPVAVFRRLLATGRGFVSIRGIDPEKYSDDELGMIFWGLGRHFGHAVPQSFMGDRLGTVMDLTDEEPDPRRRRGYHSAGFQSVHTDACDIVGMIGIRTAKQGGASRLVSAAAVHNAMLDMCPDLLAVLYEGLICRMPDSDAAAMGIAPLIPHRVPAYTYDGGWLNAHYVRGYVQRAVNAGDSQLNPREQAAIDVFLSIGNHPDFTLEYMLEPGDIQIFNNRTILHGRAHFQDHPEKDRRRHLKRLWLQVEDWPEIPASQRALYGGSPENWRDPPRHARA